jgi:hypothetical protein
MDRLGELLEAARPLLARVDEVLTTVGAPAEHPIWAELRRVRLLPGAAARAVAALRPAAFGAAIPELRADARACGELAASLPPPDDWTGEAAEAYDAARRRTAAQLSGGHLSLDERLEATADLAQALTDWMERTRADLADALAEALTSSEALTLSTGGAATPPPLAEIRAAAGIAAHLLQVIADSYERAADLLHGSAPLTTPTLR